MLILQFLTCVGDKELCVSVRGFDTSMHLRSPVRWSWTALVDDFQLLVNHIWTKLSSRTFNLTFIYANLEFEYWIYHVHVLQVRRPSGREQGLLNFSVRIGDRTDQLVTAPTQQFEVTKPVTAEDVEFEENCCGLPYFHHGVYAHWHLPQISWRETYSCTKQQIRSGQCRNCLPRTSNKEMDMVATFGIVELAYTKFHSFLWERQFNVRHGM